MDNYVPLTLRYRPQLFKDLVGQEVVAKTLQNMLQAGRVHPSLIFGGSRGVGKTTTARVVARALNCENKSADCEPCGQCDSCKDILEETSWAVQEMDAASHGSVDDIRRIKNDLNYTNMAGQYRVFILDECHALSNQAWQAFLKLLEEPPPRVIFVFCSTETSKIPETISSRSQNFTFARLSVETICLRLKQVVEKEAINIDHESMIAIARSVNGGMRDALSLMDQLVTYAQGKVEIKHVQEVLGVVPRITFIKLVKALSQRQIKTVYDLLQEVYSQISDVSAFIRDFLLFFHDLVLVKLNVQVQDHQEDFRKTCSDLTKDLSLEYLLACQSHLQLLLDQLNRANLPARAVIDAGMIHLLSGGVVQHQQVQHQAVRVEKRVLTVDEVKVALNAQLLS